MSDQMDEKSKKIADPDGFAYSPRTLDPQPRDVISAETDKLRRAMHDEITCAPMGVQRTGVRGMMKK